MTALERSAALTHGMKEQCEASGATPSQIEFWCRLGLVVPVKESTGRGDHRQFNAENILEATQALELTRAGYSSKQLQKIFAAQHAQLTALTAPARLVARYRMYIQTITLLAAAFGPGPDYDEWLKTQQRMLRRMEKQLTRLGDEGGRAVDEDLLRTLLSRPGRELRALAE